ncbi:hypothetical protein [Robertkochia solimangrovi]|uniref:hypothetical protein n=1 Tax=Robertkochia solimangrovi TaxID=2213046 RepID=UPI001180BC6B|nr:hypothetical protein [Robertkochia solimangrovi]TRZ42205.1 hypothetical protein DMZ48_14340 [Robertkochia solimangrovi]
MNQFCTYAVILIFVLGCKEKTEIEKASTENSLQKTENKSDVHPLIDLILDRVHPVELESYNLVISIDSTSIPRLTNFPPNLNERLDDPTKIKLIKTFKNKTSPIEFDKSKLNSKSKTLLDQQADKEYKIQIIFNGFLEIKEDSLAVTTIGFYYSPKGGWEEIVIFEKNDRVWRISNRIKTVHY